MKMKQTKHVGNVILRIEGLLIPPDLSCKRIKDWIKRHHTI